MQNHAFTQKENDEYDISKWRSQIVHKDGKSVDTTDLWHKLAMNIEGNNIQDGLNPIGDLGHLISGYVS